MSQSKKYIRDGEHRIIGSSETLGSITTVRDNRGRILGTTNARFATTRDARGKLLAINSDDPGLLLGQDSESD
jgi:YD repeat-containing protein